MNVVEFSPEGENKKAVGMCRSILFSSRKGENSTFFLIYYFLFII